MGGGGGGVESFSFFVRFNLALSWVLVFKIVKDEQ